MFHIRFMDRKMDKNGSSHSLTPERPRGYQAEHAAGSACRWRRLVPASVAGRLGSMDVSLYAQRSVARCRTRLATCGQLERGPGEDTDISADAGLRGAFRPVGGAAPEAPGGAAGDR